MGGSIKLKTENVKKAFEKEVFKLKDGEQSRYLPGFTALEKVEGSNNYSGDWDVWYVGVRIRDGKTYGWHRVEGFHDYYGPFASQGEYMVFKEMVKKEVVTYRFDEV